MSVLLHPIVTHGIGVLVGAVIGAWGWPRAKARIVAKAKAEIAKVS